MKKNIVFILSLTFVIALQAQKFYVTPLIGVKADIGSTKFPEQPDYFYFKYTAPRIHADLSPILLGLNLEYKLKRSIFSVGVIGGDQAASTIQLNFEVISDSPYTDFKGIVKRSFYAAHNVLKIPLSYKTELFSINSKQNRKIATLNLHTGTNLMFLKVKNGPFPDNPLSKGVPYYTLHGDTIEIVSFAGHLNRSFSMSFKFGLDVDFYVKNKRRFNIQLYYEQGTREISQSALMIYKNSEDMYWQGASAKSRGSSIQFKLGFPINVINLKPK